MIIHSIEISNFRCLRDFSVHLEPLTAFLGRNGAGKSSLLHALDIFYNTSAKISDEDFYNRDKSTQIEIRVTFGHLREDELAEFSPYISENKLIVTKRITCEDERFVQKYYSAFRQFPKFAEICL